MTIKMVRDQHKKKAIKETHNNLKISIDNSNCAKSTNASSNAVVFQEPKPWQKVTTKIVREKSTTVRAPSGELIKLPAIQSQRNSNCQTIDL